MRYPVGMESPDLQRRQVPLPSTWPEPPEKVDLESLIVHERFEYRGD